MNKAQFLKRIAASGRPIIVDFWAPWCAPCRAIEPALKNLEQAYADQVEVLRLNADEHPGLLDGLGIYGIPTLVAYHNGAEAARRTGIASQAVIEGLFKAALTGEQSSINTLSGMDRLVRLSAGMGLFSLGFVNLISLRGSDWISWGLIFLGLGIGFSGVYDRCPVYRAIYNRLKNRLQ